LNDQGKLSIVFFGTPVFAVASLQAINDNGFHIAGVVTAPDKPAGRSLHLHSSPVKDYALQHEMKLLQPTNMKDPGFQEELRGLQADIQVVIAFRMMPQAVWSMPPMGTVNLHASLLPEYRGAAPINWAIINGEKETGLTTFFLKHEIDTGNIIFQEKVSIGDEETAGELHDRLMARGAGLMVKTLSAIQQGDYPQIPQDLSMPGVPAPKIFKEDCKINWDRPAGELHNLVRGLSPSPAAWTLLGRHVFRIFRAAINVTPHQLPAGTIESDGKHYLRVATSDGFIELGEVQLEGKKRMGVAEFLRGFNIKEVGGFE
jgi:methionyl-tRNA formyltransferase